MVGIVPSIGCSKASPPARFGALLNETLLWEEPGLPAVNRTVLSYVPTAEHRKPMPLVMVFHGWGGHALTYQEKYTFGLLAEAAGFLAVYPEGLNDVWSSSSRWTSWNSGDTTVEDIDNSSTRVCDPKKVAGSTCYVSCMIKRGKCHPCSWTTCYDDVGFIKQLLQHVAESFCIDLSSVFAYGCSNGGMFVHQLARQMPEHFRAIVAACGGKPHQGYERNFTRGGPPVSMLLLQGLHDHTIPRHPPRRNAPWWDGYVYASDAAVTEAYKDYNGCSNENARVQALPPEVRSESVVCTEYGYDCLAGSQVVECTFPGGHDLLYGSGDILQGPRLAWHFFCGHMPAAMREEWSCTLSQGQSHGDNARFYALCLLSVTIFLLGLWMSCHPRCRGYSYSPAGPISAEQMTPVGRANEEWVEHRDQSLPRQL